MCSVYSLTNKKPILALLFCYQVEAGGFCYRKITRERPSVWPLNKTPHISAYQGKSAELEPVPNRFLSTWNILCGGTLNKNNFPPVGRARLYNFAELYRAAHSLRSFICRRFFGLVYFVFSCSTMLSLVNVFGDGDGTEEEGIVEGLSQDGAGGNRWWSSTSMNQSGLATGDLTVEILLW